MYQKYSGTQIFDGVRFCEPGSVLVTNTTGEIVDIVPHSEAGDDIQQLKGILCPGFINAHCHLELSHLHNKIEKGTGLIDFVQQIMRKRFAATEVKQQAMQKAIHEMANNGIVAVGDICNTTDSVPFKKDGLIQWMNFLEISGFVAASAIQRMKEMQEIAAIFKEQLPKQQAVIVPHAPYSVSKTLFVLLNEVTEGKIISMHNQECAAENEWYRSKSGAFLQLYKNLNISIADFEPTGESSFKTCRPLFSKGQQLIAVHNTFISKDDLQLTNSIEGKGQTFFCLCPSANLFIEKTLPPVDLLFSHTNNIVLGTDSLASNESLNIYTELLLLQQHFSNISLATMLQWATINGARALGWETELGSFEKRKKPGAVLLDGNAAKRIF